MEILGIILIACVVNIAVSIALGWVIEQITGERKRKELMGQYWSLRQDMDRIVENQRRLEDAAGSSKGKQGD